MADVDRGKIFCIKMYWTPAKMLLLADVDEYSFANAVSALKFPPVDKVYIFQCMGKIFCVVPFEIPHKISYPYIERCDFYTTLTF